jgi:hypothetical protein
MDVSHDHTDLGPKFRFWALGGPFSPFWPLKVYIFFIYIKFPIDWWVTWPISFLSLPVPSLGIRRIRFFFGILQFLNYFNLLQFHQEPIVNFFFTHQQGSRQITHTIISLYYDSSYRLFFINKTKILIKF